MGGVDRIDNVANRVIKSIKENTGLVVVVSAMSGKTDELINHAKFFSNYPDLKEMDMLLSAGERVSAALLAIALNAKGFSAISLSGQEAGIVTDTLHTRARIINIDTKNIKALLHAGKIVVVAGFQGISVNNETTTLGRGGSDLSAVAIAGALGASACEIYSDVDGIYTTDPRIVKNAKKIKQISYDEMLELASLGAKVLQTRSVEFAKKHNVNLIARSSFSNDSGTLILDEEKVLERPVVRAIALDKNEALISLKGVLDRPGMAASIFKSLALNAINVDLIIQNISKNGTTNLDFTVPKGMINETKAALKDFEKDVKEIEIKEDIAKVSVVGLGMKSHFGVASLAFEAMAKNNINILMIGTSEIKISMIIDLASAESAVIALHSAYKLDK